MSKELTQRGVTAAKKSPVTPRNITDGYLRREKISILRRREFEKRVGLARSTIYDKINPKSQRYDSTFPTPVRLGNGSAVGWVEYEVEAWLLSQIEASRTAE